MFISRVLMLYKHRRRIPGKIDIGKHQLVLPVTALMKARALRQLYEEKNNMDLLQRPYLTKEEEECSELARQNEHKDFLELRDSQIQKKMLKHRLIDDHLNHLNCTKQWE